jgi:3-keto-L-gulonate-6-phosphate decarboxylase
VAAVKFQSACFERYGGRGGVVLEECIREAVRHGLVVVLDVKRGDIGLTAGHYAEATRRTGAHSVTLSGYMGPSTIRPFLDAGLACLCSCGRATRTATWCRASGWRMFSAWLLEAMADVVAVSRGSDMEKSSAAKCRR